MINWIKRLFKKDIPKKIFKPIIFQLTSSTLADYLEIKVSTFKKCLEKQVVFFLIEHRVPLSALSYRFFVLF